MHLNFCNEKNLFFIFLFSTSFNKTNNGVRLIFEQEKTSRSSFCIYSDRKFYETRASGCVGQEFSFGNLETKQDTTILNYHTENIFTYEIIKSPETLNAFQTIRIVDCYNQPVRFQNIYLDTTYLSLYNPGVVRTQKGKSIFYPALPFNQDTLYGKLLVTNADTVTYKWHCNRESIESIDGGALFTNQEAKIEKVILKNKVVKRLYQ